MYFFIHIPKCGGSSVRTWLRRYFLEGAYSDTSLLNHIPYTKEECEYLRTHYDHWMKSFSSHKLNLECLDGIKADIFTTIRNPVERFISRYYYFKSNGPSKCAAKYLTLEEFIKYELIDKRCKPGTNSLVYYLCGGMGLSWLKEAIDRNKCAILSSPAELTSFFNSHIPVEVVNKSEKEYVEDSVKSQILELSLEDYNFWLEYNKNA
jgi:hypothetical protein